MVAKDDKRKILYAKNPNNTQFLNIPTVSLSLSTFYLQRKLSVMLYKQVNLTFLYIVIIFYRRSIPFLVRVVFLFE